MDATGAAAGRASAGRPRRAAGRASAGFHALGAAAAALALAGCGSLLSPLEVGPSGLGGPDHELRSLLARGRFETALAGLDDGRLDPGDDLLRLQHRGLVAHYAGRWEESAVALDSAAALAEDRVTKRLSRAALSMVLNDRVIPYDPPRAERLLIHYYGALDYLALGDPEEAAVEARRLSRLLDVHERAAAVDPRSAEARLRAALRYFAGAVFEAAGEENDAAVAYRLAGPDLPPPAGSPAAGSPARGGHAAASPPAGPGAAPHGEVLVVVERGFVAHRVERSATLLLAPGELDALRVDDPRRLSRASPAVAAALGLAGEAMGSARSGGAHRGRIGARDDRDHDGGRPLLLRVAWPEYVSTAPRGVWTPLAGDRVSPRTGDPVVTVAGTEAGVAARGPAPALAAARFSPVGVGLESASGGAAPRGDAFLVAAGPEPARAPVRWVGSLSGAVAEEHAAEAPLALAKSILRGAAKLAIARGLEEAVEEESEVLGELVGVAANVAAVLTERADTRSWHLTPAELGLVRLRVPAGRRPLSVRLPGAGELELGPVDVRADRLTVVSTRAW